MPIWFWDELMDYRWTRRLVLGAVAVLVLAFGDIEGRGTMVALVAIAATLIACEIADRLLRQGDRF